MGTQASVAPKPGASSPANPIMSFVPMIAICFILYFLLIRPQQKQASEHKKLVDGLKTGDRVLTQGGVYGIVVSIKGQVIQLKIAEGRMDVSRAAISEILTEVSNGSTPAVIDSKAE